MNQLRREVLGLYLDDYTRRWDAMLANIALKPFANMAQGLDELYLLSAPESPLRDLLQAVDAQTQLSRAAATEQVTGAAEAKVAKVGQKLGGFGAYLARSGLSIEQNAGRRASSARRSATTPTASRSIRPHGSTSISAACDDFVAGSKDKPAQLEVVIGKIQQIYQGMNQAANAPNQGQRCSAWSPAAAAAAAAVGAGAAPRRSCRTSRKACPSRSRPCCRRCRRAARR